jgi:O-antigen/teichoic acid export membrane protein
MIQLNSSFKKLISSSGLNFIFRIFGLGTSFLTTVLITRFFGVGTFGDYSLVFALSQIIALLFTLGIPNTLIKIIGNNDFTYSQAKKLLIKGLKGSLIFSLIPFLFFYLGSSFLAETVFHNAQLVNYFLIASISIPLFIVHEIFLYFLIATKNFIKYNLFMFVIPNLLLLFFLFLFFKLDKNNYFTFIAFSLAILITVLLEVFTIFELKPKKETISISTLSLIKTASPLLFSSLFMYLLNYTNVIMLGIMSNNTQVGIYNIAYKIGSVGFLVIVSVSTIMTPKIAEFYGKGDFDQLKKLTHNSTRLVALFSLPIVLCLILFSSSILSFWGLEAISGKTTLIIVSTGVLFSAMAGNVDQILNMTENQNIFRNITIFSFLVNLILCYVLIPKYNIEGAAIASLTTNILINVLCLYYIKKKLGFYTLF